MAQGSFSAKVSDWVRETKERQLFVYQESTQRTVSFMQRTRAEGGNMRVDTGFLRASAFATLSGTLPPQTAKPDGEGSFTYNPGQINLVIANADITDTITVVYTANYARIREYLGDRFVGLAAQMWNQTVTEVCAEAQSRAGG